jgi:hypothetical protein
MNNKELILKKEKKIGVNLKNSFKRHQEDGYRMRNKPSRFGIRSGTVFSQNLISLQLLQLFPQILLLDLLIF